MNKVLVILGRLARIVLAFAGAVLAASAVFMLTIGGAAVWGPAEGDTWLDAAAGLIAATILVSLFAALLIAVPTLIVITLAEFRQWRALWIHACVGVVTGMAAVALVARNDGLGVLGWGALAGLAGSVVYWAIAGRSAGSWRVSVPPATMPER